MPHSRDHARRLMRELEPFLPEEAERVLDRQSYWDPGFADLFYEYTADLISRDPQAGLKVAKVMRRLAYALPADAEKSASPQRDRLSKAYALLGTAYRATGSAKKAETAFFSALEICRKGGGASKAIRGDIYLRLAFLRAHQKRPEEADRFLKSAEGVLKQMDEGAWRGRFLAFRGAVLLFADRYAAAADALTEALGSYKLSHRVEYSATGNLAHAVARVDDPSRLAEAPAHLRRARRLCGPRRSVQKSFLYWIEGLVFVRLGSTERAEHRFRKAMEGFLKFQTPWELAQVSLDLSTLLGFAGRWTELETLASETYQRFCELQEDADALAALKLWLEAAQNRSVTVALVTEIKATLEQRKQLHSTPLKSHGRPRTT